MILFVLIVISNLSLILPMLILRSITAKPFRSISKKSFPGFPTRSKRMSISTAPGLNPFPISSTHRFISRQSLATRQVQLSTATSWSFSPVTWITWLFKTLSRWISQQVIRSVSFFRCHWLIMRQFSNFVQAIPHYRFQSQQTHSAAVP